ncbi:MAG: DUF1800 domain-containing protein [Gammaproteobacteria bacterium]
MQNRFAPAIAANRFGLGARPGELAGIGGDPRGWLVEQLKGGAPLFADTGLRTSQDILAETLELRRDKREARRASRGAPTETSLPVQPSSPGAAATDASSPRDMSPDKPVDSRVLKPEVVKLGQLYRPIYIDEVTARLRQAVSTERPFVERLTQFWTNHFAVSIDKAAVLGLAGTLEREAIRPNVLGTFSDLLLAVEHHPAMLLYLDNHLSVGQHSRAARLLARRQTERQIGINENLAREILELHTLGVAGGYSQKDVTTFAEVLTGWSIGGNTGRFNRGEPGKFTFRPEVHEPGAKTLLGKRYSEGDESEGVAVLRDVAAKPATAKFIATKLARHFIADDPPPEAVEHLAKAFVQGRGDLATVYRALVDLPAAWAQPFAKFKTPNDYVVSTFRGLQHPVQSGRGGIASFEVLGQRTYSPGSPAGWPDRGADWDGASALMKRIEWADAIGQRLGAHVSAADLAPGLLGDTLSDETRTAIARAASGAQALTLLLTAPEFLRR